MSQPTYAPALASRRSLRKVLHADPPWARPSLACLLAATTVPHVWGLGASGWANSFYSAAVQAGAHSWKAFFFGASDAANFITVDKTPMALWPMELTARVFGVNSWSILLPQALMGVATVAIGPPAHHRRIRPAPGTGTGEYGMAARRRRVRGLGLPDQDAAAFLVVPAFVLVYAVTAPAGLRRRLWQLTMAGFALLVSAGWWVAIVAAVPAGSRPYIGGSQHDSVLELAFGYNGLGRLNGDETGGLGNTNQDAGWLRMFDAELGGQIAWLLPAALILLAAGVYLTVRRTSPTVRPEPGERTGVRTGSGPRTDRGLAGFALWGGWLLVTDAVFSLMQGIFHGYYTVALAPAVAALAGMGGTVLWLRRHRPAAAVTLAAVVALTGWWAYRILGRTPDFAPWLRVPVLVGALIAAAALTAGRWLPRRVLTAGAVLAIATCLAGPSAYAIETASTAHHGAIPSAGPTGAFGGAGFPGGMRGGPNGTRRAPGGPPGTSAGPG